MENVVIGALGFANRALLLLSGVGIIAMSLIYLWLKDRWWELARRQRWGDPWTDWASLSQARSNRLEREKQVA